VKKFLTLASQTACKCLLLANNFKKMSLLAKCKQSNVFIELPIFRKKMFGFNILCMRHLMHLFSDIACNQCGVKGNLHNRLSAEVVQ